MHTLVREFEREYMKKSVPDFRPGDTVRVAVRIIEGDKERIQNYEGVVIGRNGSGMSETFTVRRVSFGIGMERIFPLHSPRIESIKVMRHGRVRRAKLYYLRDLTGRKARIADTRRKRGAKDTMVQLLSNPALAEAVVPAEAQVESAPIVATESAPVAEAPATEAPATEAPAAEAPAAEGAGETKA